MPALGPLSSALVGGERGTRLFYIDLTNQLETSELVTGTPTVESQDDAVTISDAAVNTSVIYDGSRAISVGKAVQFRATTAEDFIGDVYVDCHYATDDSNTDTVRVTLHVIPVIT